MCSKAAKLHEIIQDSGNLRGWLRAPKESFQAGYRIEKEIQYKEVGQKSSLIQKLQN